MSVLILCLPCAAVGVAPIRDIGPSRAAVDALISVSVRREGKMAEGKSFRCPSCGANLVTDGTSPEMRCDYCGNTVVVPEELRVAPQQPSTPPATPLSPQAIIAAELADKLAERLAEEPAVRPPPERRRKSGGCGGLFLFLLLIAAGIIASSLKKGSQLQLPFLPTATPTPVPISVPLTAALPREVSYAGAKLTVTHGEITNRVIGSSGRPIRVPPGQAYAVLSLSVTNPSTSRMVSLPSGIMQLQLGDGKTYYEANGWQASIDRQATVESRAYFEVPGSAKWQGAKLLLEQPNKEPAMLPLDGPVPSASYPIKLAAGGEATAQDATYKVLSATLDLDSDGERADVGKRFLRLMIRVTNNSSFSGGMALGNDNFRLLVNEVPLAPTRAPIEVVNAKSALEGEVDFIVDATAKTASLQVGEVGHGQTAAIPLALNGK